MLKNNLIIYNVTIKGEPYVFRLNLPFPLNFPKGTKITLILFPCGIKRW